MVIEMWQTVFALRNFSREFIGVPVVVQRSISWIINEREFIVEATWA
jgi:hypothetical protein